jgi:hypothetical protein
MRSEGYRSIVRWALQVARAIVAAVATVALASVLVLWARSYWALDRIEVETCSADAHRIGAGTCQTLIISSHRGRLVYMRHRDWAERADALPRAIAFREVRLDSKDAPTRPFEAAVAKMPNVDTFQVHRISLVEMGGTRNPRISGEANAA